VIRTSISRAIVPGIAVLALALSGCGAGNESDGNSDAGSSDGASSLSGELNGGGATSQEKAEAAWAAGFQDANPDVTVNYDPVGSGTGRENFINGAFSFAGTDSALSNDEGELDAAIEKCGGDSVIQVPAYVSPIAVTFNLPGVDSLNLRPEVIAQIFDGSITTWDDQAIAKDNPDADLPSTKIVPVHRSDDSGTTENFTAYLQAAGGWSEDPDGVWPDSIKGGESAEGTSGVVGLVTDNEGYVTYADDSAVQDTDLGVVAVGVGSEFNAPSAEGAAKVVALSQPSADATDTNLAIDLARDTTESGTYPVLLVSYLLACPTYDDAEVGSLVKAFMEYVVSDQGQQDAAAEAKSAPLEASVAAKAQAAVATIDAG
jgi:phosphate transport system substrate-binding protein